MMVSEPGINMKESAVLAVRSTYTMRPIAGGIILQSDIPLADIVLDRDGAAVLVSDLTRYLLHSGGENK